MFYVTCVILTKKCIQNFSYVRQKILYAFLSAFVL